MRDAKVSETPNNYIEETRKLIKEIIGEYPDEISMLHAQQVTRTNYLVEVGTRKYVIHFPRTEAEWKMRNDYRTSLKLNNPFEIIETREGVLIEEYAVNKFLWTERIISELLSKLYLLHHRKDVIIPKQDKLSYLKHCEKQCEKVCSIPNILYYAVHEKLLRNEYYYKPTLCHGDLWSANVLLWKESFENSEYHPYIIDWELVCMGDPYYDLAKLYVSVVWGEETTVLDPYEWLSYYLKDNLEESELFRFNYMLLFFYYVAILHDIRERKTRDDAVKKLVDYINCFEIDKKSHFEGGRL